MSESEFRLRRNCNLREGSGDSPETLPREYHKRSSFIIGSDLEDDGEPNIVERKPSRISIAENLTVICDNETEEDIPETEQPTPNIGLFDYCWSELTRGYSFRNEQSRYTEKRNKIYAFFKIPFEVEKFLVYGQLQCIDAFCYLFTFLPIRFLMSTIGFCLRIKTFGSAEICDLFKVAIILVGSFIMQYIDTSMVYHEVRSQSVIKLYIFYNMLEVADKLFSSFGQDVLEALYWTANEKKNVSNVLYCILHFFVALLCTVCHAFLVLLQATTLNVAFNSHNQSLLAIMMSNNFVELKGAVFKKFAKANLFQMACSDVRERFHLTALMFVVLLRNMAAVNWSSEHFAELLPDFFMVIVAELLVDYVKHAFITKFNEINTEVYRDFTITIAFDVVKTRDSSAFSDYSDQVSRRMGLIPIPLAIVIIKVVMQTFDVTSTANICIFVLIWILLLLIKIGNGILLLGVACKQVSTYKDLQARAEYDIYRKRMVEKKSKSVPNSPRMSLVDFTDVLHQPSGVKGFTASDVIHQLQDLSGQIRTSERRSSERDNGDRTPRRTLSLANLPRGRRDKSEPPPSIPEGEEKSTREDESTEKDDRPPIQSSPKKKILPAEVDCEGLADVQAYTMLPPEQGVERIE